LGLIARFTRMNITCFLMIFLVDAFAFLFFYAFLFAFRIIFSFCLPLGNIFEILS